MSLALQVLQIVTPVFVLAAIGWTWVRMGWEYNLQFVTRLSMTLAIPCLIFVALVRAEIEPGELRAVVIATLVAYGLVAAVTAAVLLVLRRSFRTFLAPITFGNTGNVGLPVALLAYGDAGLALAVVVFAVMAILSFTLGIWVVSGGGNPLRALQEPMVGATLLGALFMVMDWSIPDVAMVTLDMIGQIGIPLMLITLGVAVARLEVKSMLFPIVLSLFKVVLCFGAAWWAAQQWGLSDVASGVLILQVAMPVAVTSYMLAAKYEADAETVAGMVVVSTLLAIPAIPVMLSFVLS